jgi:hypothetical protein
MTKIKNQIMPFNSTFVLIAMKWLLLINYFSNVYAQDIKVTPVKLGKGAENVFASSYHNGYLYYCSDKIEKNKKNQTNVINERANFLNLYRIKMGQDGALSDKSFRLSDSINSPFNDGPLTFSLDGKMSYFSSNVFLDPTDSTLLLGLYQAEFTNATFGKRQLIDELTIKGVNVAHPVVYQNDNMLIFVSDEANGKGKADLYYSYKKEGKWSAPINMTEINSEYTETFPTVFNNRLYFASDRPGGLGGLDIYVTTFTNGSWTAPIALPSPINSASDDFLFISIDGKRGFFTSNRTNFQDRIFTFNYTIPSIEKFNLQKIDTCFTFKDDFSEDNGDLIYHWKIDGKLLYKSPTFTHCFPGIGRYTVSCDILESSENRLHENVAETDVVITYSQPLISVQIDSANQLKLSCIQDFSEKQYKNWYWKINNINYYEQAPAIDKQSILDIKLVLWNNDKDAIGFQYEYHQKNE